MTIQDLILKDAQIIDVRTPDEYMGGHVNGSKNIPLNEIPDKISAFREMKGPLVLCCLSGGRSGQAVQFLQANGIECYNGGGWTDVNYIVNSQL